MNAIISIRYDVETNGFFDAFENLHDFDLSASTARYAELVTDRLSRAYPGVEITVNMLRVNQFVHAPVTITYEDGYVEDYSDADDVATVQAIAGEIWESGAYMVEADPRYAIQRMHDRPRTRQDNGGVVAIRIRELTYGAYDFSLFVGFDSYNKFWYYMAYKHEGETRWPLTSNAVVEYDTMQEAQEAAIAAIICLVDTGSVTP